jgi:hypothetical protein
MACGTKSYSGLLLSLNFLSIHCTAACWSSDPLVGGVGVVVESRVREVDRDRTPPRVDPKPRRVAWVHFRALVATRWNGLLRSDPGRERMHPAPIGRDSSQNGDANGNLTRDLITHGLVAPEAGVAAGAVSSNGFAPAGSVSRSSFSMRGSWRIESNHGSYLKLA